MDLHIRSLLCHHCLYSFVSQLQNLVFSGTPHDHLHCLVPHHCLSSPWPGITSHFPNFFSCLILKYPSKLHSLPLRFQNNTVFSFISYIIIIVNDDDVNVNVKVEGVKHTGPSKLVLYFTGATNILYTFGGHAVTV